MQGASPTFSTRITNAYGDQPCLLYGAHRDAIGMSLADADPLALAAAVEIAAP